MANAEWTDPIAQEGNVQLDMVPYRTAQQKQDSPDPTAHHHRVHHPQQGCCTLQHGPPHGNTQNQTGL